MKRMTKYFAIFLSGLLLASCAAMDEMVQPE